MGILGNGDSGGRAGGDRAGRPLLVGGDDPEGACRKLTELGLWIVGVVLGAKGHAGFARGRLIRKPADPVEAIDTTGCGGLCHVGFILGLHQKWGSAKCFDFGAWAAAQASRRLAGRSGIPTTGEEMKKQGVAEG